MSISAEELVTFLSKPAPRRLDDNLRRRALGAWLPRGMHHRLLIMLILVLIVLLPLLAFAAMRLQARSDLIIIAILAWPVLLSPPMLIRFMVPRIVDRMLSRGEFTVGQIEQYSRAMGCYRVQVVYEWSGRTLRSFNPVDREFAEQIRACRDSGRWIGILVDPAQPDRILIPGRLLSREQADAFALTEGEDVEVSAPAERETDSVLEPQGAARA